MASLQNIEKSIFISEFSLRENDFVALVRRVLYKTTALWLFDKNCGNGVFLPFQAFVKSMKI
ncbi:MAG: hypothetical protein ACK5LY_07970 [Lachnospirales bacterium]